MIIPDYSRKFDNHVNLIIMTIDSRKLTKFKLFLDCNDLGYQLRSPDVRSVA